MRNKYEQTSLIDTCKSVSASMEVSAVQESYPLAAFLKGLVLQKMFGYVNDSVLVAALRHSLEMQKFCGFQKVFDAAKLTRFKQDFLPHTTSVRKDRKDFKSLRWKTDRNDGNSSIQRLPLLQLPSMAAPSGAAVEILVPHQNTGAVSKSTLMQICALILASCVVLFLNGMSCASDGPLLNILLALLNMFSAWSRENSSFHNHRRLYFSCQHCPAPVCGFS